MLKISDFANEIQKGLNQNAYGLNFAIFSDEGTYKDALISRTAKTRYTNGLLRVGASTIVPTQGLTVATQTAALEICVPLFNPDTDEAVIQNHRAALDAYFQQYRVDSMKEYDENDNVVKVYTVSSLSSLANTGDVDVRDGVGTSITFYVNIEFAYIQNGLNSANCTFTLDGFTIPYTAAKITKSPTAQTDAFSDSNGRGESVNTSFVRSFDFQLPAQSGADNLASLIISELLGVGLNTPHTLVVTIGDDDSKTYNVVFGQTDISLEGINNAGHNISLIERPF
ncbi:MAG: hypothetical protein K2M89_06380 [Clostridiales bacterium]|nr:hypothetical protein [Clostridiales bacterium]